MSLTSARSLHTPNPLEGDTIHRPAGYDGPIIFEAELGIVIGKECSNIDEGSAADYIFGYTCVNDVTATGLLKQDFPAFQQWGFNAPGLTTNKILFCLLFVEDH